MTTFSRHGNEEINIRETITGLEYSLDNSNWNPLDLNGCTIENQDATLGLPDPGMLKVIFRTDITIDDTSKYFTLLSGNIQFGTNTLKTNGTRPKITITCTYYDGLIQNGSASSNGYDNISVYNLIIDGSTNDASVTNNHGWFGKEYFGKHASNNYFINCSSTGEISNDCGGIVGAYAGSNTGNVTAIGCSSSGLIKIGGGGIFGAYAGNASGTATAQKCFSTGEIRTDSGGIFGEFAGTSGTASATGCYSTGLIHNGNAGGIFGSFAGQEFGTVNATTCYSRGNIGTNSGGIFGRFAGYNPDLTNEGTVTATNCYSDGTITTSGTGIFGSDSIPSAVSAHTYASGNHWDDSTASMELQGIPTNVIGTTWVSLGINMPYELLDMGYTPYNLTNISTNNFNNSYNVTLAAGASTDAAYDTTATFAIILKQGTNSASFSTITINTQGIISTTTETAADEYTLYIRHVSTDNPGGYNISIVYLTTTSSGGGGGGGGGGGDTLSRVFWPVVFVLSISLLIYLRLLFRRNKQLNNSI